MVLIAHTLPGQADLARASRRVYCQVGLYLALSDCANNESSPAQGAPLALDHRGPTAIGASQPRTRTSFRPWGRHATLEASLPMAAMVTSGVWRPSCQDGMWDDTHPPWVSFICDLGRVHGSFLGAEQKMEGVQGRLQKLHYLSSRKLRGPGPSLSSHEDQRGPEPAAISNFLPLTLHQATSIY